MSNLQSVLGPKNHTKPLLFVFGFWWGEKFWDSQVCNLKMYIAKGVLVMLVFFGTESFQLSELVTFRTDSVAKTRATKMIQNANKYFIFWWKVKK